MTFLRVKNWERFQHYKERNPPWIRLYNELLDDYAFSRLQDASKWHAVGIWLLASRFDNRVPNDPKWIGQRINARSPVDVDSLINAGFLEPYGDASNVLADCTQDAKPEAEAEKRQSRGETDAETALGATSAETKKGRKRRCVLWHVVPADFVVLDSHRKLAASLGVDVELEAEKYRDHEFDKPKSDANRTFNNWLRTAAEMKARNGNGHPPAGSPAKQVRAELPQSNRNGARTPVRVDGHDPAAEARRKEREEDERIEHWKAAHPQDAEALAQTVQDEMAHDPRWKGTPLGIVTNVARARYRSLILEKLKPAPAVA